MQNPARGPGGDVSLPNGGPEWGRVTKNELALAEAGLDAYLSVFDECAITPTRKLIAAYVRGQLGPLPRKSVMPMAREAGIAPRTLQELLSLHRWDEERMRQILRERIGLSHGGPDAVVLMHESECPKKGTKTPGVDRQLLRSLGRSANACVISNLALFGPDTALLVDSELFLTPRWCQDRTLRRAAGIPEETRYRSREEVALELLDRNWSAGLRFGLLVLDPGRALEGPWRRLLQARGIPFAGEVAPRARGWVPKGGEARIRAVEEIVASEGGLSAAGRVLPFLPEGALPDDPPLSLVASRPPWSAQLRYAVLGGPCAWDPERAVERALARPGLVTRLERGLGAIGFDHFEVRRFLSLRRHLVLSAASLQFLADSRPLTAAERPSAPLALPLRAAPR